MKTIAIVQARMASIRFPNKVMRAINGARTIAFLVKGAGKANILASVLDDRLHGDSAPPAPPAPPAALVRPAAGRLYWLIDRAAATLL